MPEFSNNMLYYNAEEAARELDRSAPEIESLILSGRLQTEIVDGKRVIPAQALEDFHAGISLPDIKARVILEEGNNDRLVEPDQIASPPGNSDAGESHNVDPEGAYYYSPSQAAELLSTDLYKVNKLVNRGELPAVSINKHRCLPAKAVEDLVRQRYGPGKLKHAPQPRRIQQLGNKVPKEPQVETDATADKRSVNSSKPQNSQTEDYRDTRDTREYFTPEQIAFALQRTQRDIDRMIQWDEIKTATINGHRWVSKEEAERIISRREPQRQARIRRRLPQPHKISEQPPTKTSPDVISNMELVDAAQRFGTSTNEIRQMIATGKLVRHPNSGHLVKSAQDSSEMTSEGARSSVQNLPDSPTVQASPGVTEPSPHTQQESEAQIKRLQDQLQAGEEAWQHITAKLEQERRDSEKANLEAQNEINQLNAEIKNLRSDVELEWSQRTNIERQAEELQSKLEDEHARRLDAEKRINISGPGTYGRKEYERQLAHMRSRIESMQRDHAAQIEVLGEDLDEERSMRIASELRAEKLEEETQA